MTNFGVNPNMTSLPAASCGMTPHDQVAAAPGPKIAGPPAAAAGFVLPAGPAPFAVGVAHAMPHERFISSMAGGVIVGKDGAPAGRVPAGSFIDTKDGSIYDAAGKPLTLPAGSTVDFFDLPDVAELLHAAAAPGKAAQSPIPTGIAGQWGPGGVTDFTQPAEAADGAPSKVAGASGPGNQQIAALQTQLQQGLARLTEIGATLHGAKMPDGVYPPGIGKAFNPAIHAGGLGTGVAGVRGLGTLPGLHASLRELIDTLRDLAKALQQRAPSAPPKAVTPVDSTSTVEPPKAPAPVDSSTSTSTSTPPPAPTVSEPSTDSEPSDAASATTAASTDTST